MNPLTMPPSAGIIGGAGAPATRGLERTVAHPIGGASERSEAIGHVERVGELPSPVPQRRVVTKRRGLTIGYVVDRFPRASHDFVFQEILELQSLGIEVNVFSLDMPDGRIDDTAIALARLEHPVRYFAADAEPDVAQIRPVLDADAARTATESRQAQWLASQVMAARIDHLHAHAATAPIDVARQAARLTSVGYSFTARADGLDADGPSLRERIVDARFVVTPTDFERGHLLRLCGSEVARKLHRVAVGIDPKEYRFSEPECHDSNSVLATGPLVPTSGFTDLIDAIAILRARGRVVRLTIVGEGELEETLRTRIDREGLDHVQLLSGASRSQLAMLMRMHTAVVVPWVGDAADHDALAHVVLEAMAVGAVVLSTDRPGLRELIDDGLTGRVISAGDPVGLSGALETLFEYRDLRERMASRARAKVEKRFTAARNVSHLAGLFMDAVVKNGLAT
jgi:glycosyltransferase involved in cell wall biosynthesis